MRILFKFLASIKASYLPALIVLSAALFCTLDQTPESFSFAAANITFYILCGLSFVFLFISKDTQNLFLAIITLLLYLTAVHVFRVGKTEEITVLHSWLMLLTPFNILLCFKAKGHLSYMFAMFCALLLEATILENFYLEKLSNLPLFFDMLTLGAWLFVFLDMLFSISFAPSFKDNAYFFASALIFLGLVNFYSPIDVIVIFSSVQVILLVAHIHDFLYNYFRDEVTGVYSLNSFRRHDSKLFPPKYTVAFFYIDNYTKLLKVFGQSQTDKLTKMVLMRVCGLDIPAQIYRLKPNEFCFIFFEHDVKQVYEMVEEMRRLVASTEFVLSKKKVLKLTITPAVSEKRRSDADVFAVLMRMYENFSQKYRFTQNMTFCEEIENMKKTRRGSSRS